MFMFIGEHLSEIAAVLAVGVAAYTAWSNRKKDIEDDKNEDGKVTSIQTDSIIKLIEPLNKRIDELLVCQKEYANGVKESIVTLRTCREAIDEVIITLQKINISGTGDGTRKMVQEIRQKINE